MLINFCKISQLSAFCACSVNKYYFYFQNCRFECKFSNYFSVEPKNIVIPAGMPESSAMDGNLATLQVLDWGEVLADSFTSM